MADTLLQGARLLLQLGLAGLRPRDHHLNGGRRLGTEPLDLGHGGCTLLRKLRVEVRPALVVLGFECRRLPMELLVLDAQAHRQFGLLLGPATGELLLLVLTSPLQVRDLLQQARPVSLQAPHIGVRVFLDVAADVGGAS